MKLRMWNVDLKISHNKRFNFVIPGVLARRLYLSEGRRGQGDVHREKGQVASGRRRWYHGAGDAGGRLSVRGGQRFGHRRESYRESEDGQRPVFGILGSLLSGQGRSIGRSC